MTDPLGQSQVIPYLQGLVKEGHEVHILSCEKECNFASNQNDIKNILLKSGIPWYPIMYTKNPPVLSTLYDVIKLKKKAAFLERQLHFDLVHCRSYIAAEVGDYLKKRFGVKFLFDIRGFWADERVEGGIWNLNNPVYNLIYKFFKRREKHFFSYADSIVALTYKAKDYIEKNFPVKNEVTVIPCAVDEKFFNQSKNFDGKAVKKELGIENQLVLGYLGSIGTWYLLDEMLDFYCVFRKKHSSTTFFFMTREAKSIIYEKAKEKGIASKEIVVVSLERSEIPKYLSAVDYSVFFIKETFSKDASSPTKHGELLSAGISVVFNDIGDLAQISKEGGGVLVDGFDNQSYTKSIDELLNHQQNSVMVMGKYYSLEKGVGKYAALYSFLNES
jgi:glycosyltransferase involved in cell wall biosynthesis